MTKNRSSAMLTFDFSDQIVLVKQSTTMLLQTNFISSNFPPKQVLDEFADTLRRTRTTSKLGDLLEISSRRQSPTSKYGFEDVF